MGTRDQGKSHWPAFGTPFTPTTTREDEAGIVRTQSDSLPPITHLDPENRNTNPSADSRNRFVQSQSLPSMATGMTAPSTTPFYQNAPHHAYNYSAPPSHRSAYAPPSRPEDREKDLPQPAQPISAKIQSLPSIYEALGKDNPLPHPPSTISAPPQPPSHIAASQAPISSASLPGPSAEGPTGPSNPFSSAPFREGGPALNAHPGAPSGSEGSIRSQDSAARSNYSVNSHKSPSHSSAEAGSMSTTHSTGFEVSSSQTSTAMSSPTNYTSTPYGQNLPFAVQHPSAAPPGMAAFPPAPYDGRQPQWPYPSSTEPIVADHGNHTRNSVSQVPHRDSVKRHLEHYDVRASLNEVGDASTRTLDLLRTQAARAHQHSRSGSVGSALPALSEIDEMIQMHRRSSDVLERVRHAIVTHEESITKQHTQQPQPPLPFHKPNDEYKGGPFGNDAKKRRGKAAPPGRCHSCNRAETPEWRRGPDGARTLCNACGLHYAKLTRKVGASKASSMTPSIRPRGSVGARSPNST